MVGILEKDNDIKFVEDYYELIDIDNDYLVEGCLVQVGDILHFYVNGEWVINAGNNVDGGDISLYHKIKLQREREKKLERILKKLKL